MYDAIVAGGSISGLLAAREIAKGGNSVLVLEEGFEVGSPEHCGGLVSKSALNDLGIKPSVKSFDSRINSAKVFELLAKSGILVRKMDVYGIKNSLRITIGTTSENITLIKKMRKILNVR